MRALRFLLLLALMPLLAACAAASGSTATTGGTLVPVQSQGRLDVMVLGDDSDPATVARSNRIFRRVLLALEDELHFAGYDTWSEQAVAADFAQDVGRRGEAEILEIAHLVDQPPIDVAVIFSVYPEAVPTANATRIGARLTGKLISIPDGRSLGAFQVESPDTWTAPANCAGDCLLEALGDGTRVLAQSLGEVLVAMLDDQIRGDPAAGPLEANALARSFTLVFQGFDAADTRLIEEYLVAFSGYQNHRLVYTAPRHTEYAYMTTDEAGELLRKFDAMLDRIGVVGTVFAAGNEFAVVYIPTQDGRRVNAEGL